MQKQNVSRLIAVSPPQPKALGRKMPISLVKMTGLFSRNASHMVNSYSRAYLLATTHQEEDHLGK